MHQDRRRPHDFLRFFFNVETVFVGGLGEAEETWFLQGAGEDGGVLRDQVPDGVALAVGRVGVRGVLEPRDLMPFAGPEESYLSLKSDLPPGLEKQKKNYLFNTQKRPPDLYLIRPANPIRLWHPRRRLETRQRISPRASE